MLAFSETNREPGEPTMAAAENPKLDSVPPFDNAKDPADWVSGSEPMTAAQASYLKMLCMEADDPTAFEEGLTKTEAAQRIDMLKAALAR
jgi:hypothetical protein